MFTRHFPHWPPGQPKTFEVPRETVYANLAASAARYPHARGNRLLRQPDLLRAAQARSRRACRLPAAPLGVARGDRVLLYAQNCPQYVIAYYAILRADAVVVPVNPMNRTEELRHYVEDSDAARRDRRPGRAARDRRRLRLTHVLPIVYSDYLEAATDLPVPEFVRARG